MEIKTDVPMTVVCSKTTQDVISSLEGVMQTHNISADVMCMIIRDVSSHFERMRADDYNNTLIHLIAKVSELKQENEALKKASDLFNMEGKDDNTNNQS